jgi:hypothetical protein
MHVMPAFCLAFPGITYQVTNNLFDCYKGSFDLYVVVIFKLSCPWQADTLCMFWCCRFSHFPWIKCKLANDAALAMCRTEQILCFWSIFNSLLQVSSLHCPTSWPRIHPGPCRLLPCIMLPASQDSHPVRNARQALRFRCIHCTSKFANCLASESWTVITASNSPLELDVQILATASQCLLLDVPVFYCQLFGNMIP